MRDFKELKVWREVTALVHVSAGRYKLSRDHLIRNNAIYRCELYNSGGIYGYLFLSVTNKKSLSPLNFSLPRRRLGRS